MIFLFSFIEYVSGDQTKYNFENVLHVLGTNQIH